MRDQTAIRVLLAALVVFGCYATWSYVKRRAEQARRQCVSNLYAIEGTKEQFAIEHDGVAPTEFTELVPGYLPSIPMCPSGGTYTLGNNQTGVVCNADGHIVNWD